LNISVGSTVAAGTYTLTVTATGGGITNTTTVSLTVTTPNSGSFTISVSPTSGYLYRGQSGYATVSTAISGGFNSSVALSATGVPSGVGWSFTPSAIAAPGSGSAHFNLSVASTAIRGTYYITITGTGGGQSHSTVLTFQIR